MQIMSNQWLQLSEEIPVFMIIPHWLCFVQSRSVAAGPPMSLSPWPRAPASCPPCVSSRRTSTCPRVCATWPDVTPRTTSGPGSPSRLCSLQTHPPQERGDKAQAWGASVVAVCLTDRLLHVTRWPTDRCYLESLTRFSSVQSWWQQPGWHVWCGRGLYVVHVEEIKHRDRIL